MTIPKRLLQFRMCDEKLSCRSPLQDSDHVCNGLRGWKTEKQMDVVRLNLFGEHGIAALGADLREKRTQRLGDISRQYAFSILWAPHHIVNFSQTGTLGARMKIFRLSPSAECTRLREIHVLPEESIRPKFLHPKHLGLVRE